MDATWDYANAREYVKRIHEGMPPVLISAAVTGEHQKSDNPGVPVTAEEQADEAADVYTAGARIIHIHARQAHDPTKSTNDPSRYREINAMMREKAPDILIDNSQTVSKLSTPTGALIGSAYFFRSAPIEAAPDIMSLNPGPMTFRSGASYTGGVGIPSTVYATTFDHTERAANTAREHGIKPQVFLYHPGHLDILDHLIANDALDKPYFVQLVFGQQSGSSTSPENVMSMIRNLPEDTIFQTCALGLEEIQVNVLSLLLGGHVRTGLEDSLLFQKGTLAQSNVQLVERIVRIANALGRRVATAEEARRMLGIRCSPNAHRPR